MAPKPLGGPAYGSIPHVPGSRLGFGDYHCAPGQARIALEQARDRQDVIWVTEKLDGSNCGVACLSDGLLTALIDRLDPRRLSHTVLPVCAASRLCCLG